MPVGTRAGVNCLTVNELETIGSQIILGGNTYHMLCEPGMEVIYRAGGMHRFMTWDKPMLTDSGGFQIFSLSERANLCTIDEKGAHFRHPLTGDVVDMSPEISLKTQKTIGADIIMAFDQCTRDDIAKDKAAAIMERTHRWLLLSKEYHEQHPLSDYGYQQALFGIVQGGVYRDLREKSAEFVASLDLDGFAIGGESIGFNMAKTKEILSWLEAFMPDDKTRYAMGVGLSPDDLCEVVALGVDIFDCVAPTRNARHGALYCGEWVMESGWLRFKSDYPKERLQIKSPKFANDERPIMALCECYTCTHYSRAALRALYKDKAPLFASLASIHNIAVMQKTCDLMKACISDDETTASIKKLNQ